MLDHLMVFLLGAVIVPIIVMVALFYAIMFVEPVIDYDKADSILCAKVLV